MASCSFDELVDAAVPGQQQFLQLYVNTDRERSREFVQHAEQRGIKGLFITVDAPQLGRREKASISIWLTLKRSYSESFFERICE